jgi:hypothetical protein
VDIDNQFFAKVVLMAQQNSEEKQQTLTDEQKELHDYNNETKERMAKYVIGGHDTLGNPIKRIFIKGDEFVIYEIDGVSSIESMRVYIRTEKKDDIALLKNYQVMQDEFNKFRSVLYKTNADSSYKYRAANALAVALSGGKDVNKAKELLEAVTEEALIEYRDIQSGRLWYLCGAVVISALTALAGLGFYVARTSEFVATNQGLMLFVYSSAFSAFGGLFSISIKLKDILIEKALDNFKYVIYGAQRLLFSILAGFAVVVLVKSRIIFADLTSGNDNLYALLTICYLAGFSETIMPNALKKLEGMTEKN